MPLKALVASDPAVPAGTGVLEVCASGALATSLVVGFGCCAAPPSAATSTSLAQAVRRAPRSNTAIAAMPAVAARVGRISSPVGIGGDRALSSSPHPIVTPPLSRLSFIRRCGGLVLPRKPHGGARAQRSVVQAEQILGVLAQDATLGVLAQERQVVDGAGCLLYTS